MFIRDLERVRKHPVAKYLSAIGRVTTLDDFLTATSAFDESPQDNVRRAWRHIGAELAGAAVTPPLPTPPPNPPLQIPTPLEGGFDEDDDLEALSNGVRGIASLPENWEGMVAPGEPPAELTTTTYTAPLIGPLNNPDARDLAKYQAWQVVWHRNALLLTNHPDVLPPAIFRRTLNLLIEELTATDDAGLRLGLVALLLQAVTGRTSKSLQAVQVVDQFEPARPRPFELSMKEGAFRLRVFFLRDRECERVGSGGTGKGDGSDRNVKTKPPPYFRPTPEQAEKLEPTIDHFLLPLPSRVVEVLRRGLARTGFRAVQLPELDSWIRAAARYVSVKLGISVVAGQVRRSFAAYLFEACRDTALTQLVCADTLGQSEAPLHYYAPRARDVAGTYRSLLEKLLEVKPPERSVDATESRVGSQLLVRGEVARALVSGLGSTLHAGVDWLVAAKRAVEIHDAMVAHLGCMILASVGHRPVNSLFRLTLADVDLEAGAAWLRDKVHDPAHDPRLVALPACVVHQIDAYLAHLVGLARIFPKLKSKVSQVLAGKSALLFGLSAAGDRTLLTVKTFTRLLPAEWQLLPLNWGRTWIRTRGIEAGLPPELASLQLGHLESGGFPFSFASPTEPAAFVNAMRPWLDRVARMQGWEIHHGLDEKTKPVVSLPPLQSWASRVARHERAARKLADAWAQAGKSRMNSYQHEAETYVLSHPAIRAAGIDVSYADKVGPWQKHSIAKAVANALRDEMVEDAGSDVALGLARSDALRKVLKRVNRRAGMPGEEPDHLMPFRRPVDNAFVPGMAVALRQVRALRQAALIRGAEKPDDWRDFPLACARAAYALAVFGFCDEPSQIEGALEHRRQLTRSASLDDVVLVPYGDQPEQVIGVRGLAAVAVAYLAKKYPAQTVPARVEINRALTTLVPEWAIPRKFDAGGDLLQLLCETVSVSNRFELSPAARLALDSNTGSVCADIREQVALLDADPVGTIERDPEATSARTELPAENAPRKRAGDARTQYLALCRTIPAQGKDLSLPLTGQRVAADQLQTPGTRKLVIEEIAAQLAAKAPEGALQPVVRLFARWVLQMLEEGTVGTKDPRDSTVSTYLTRIGGHLTGIFGNASMDDVGDAELEDAYLAAVESGRDARDKAAAAVLSFHACCVRRFGFPELDLCEVRAYLASDARHVDAALILPGERAAALSGLVKRGTLECVGEAAFRETVRVDRQASAAMPLYAYGGARCSEVLGLRFADVFAADGEPCYARMRANRSRRLKTRAARRSVYLGDNVPRQSVESFVTWVRDDRSRLPGWRSDDAYLFSPLDNGRLATGRSAVAAACSAALADATGRRNERLHRLRHLVAFEKIIALFLSDRDRDALSHTLAAVPSGPAGIALPRDLAASVVTLGHAQPVTSLRCYFHLPWLLRSRADAAIRAKYFNRRGVAFVMGSTPSGADQITKRHKSLTPAQAWLVHVAAVRVVPAALVRETPDEVHAPHRWTAVELGRLLRCVERTGSLQGALNVMGADTREAKRLQSEFLLFEKRMGRRIVAGEWIDSVGMPRRIARDVAAAAGLEDWWRQFDAGSEDERGQLARAAVQVFEQASPSDDDTIKVPSSVAAGLVTLIERVLPSVSIERKALDLGIDAIRVARSSRAGTEAAKGKAASAKAKTRYLGVAIKRALGVVWVAHRLAKDAT